MPPRKRGRSVPAIYHAAGTSRSPCSDGAKFLVRAGRFENPEGKVRARNVVLEFPDYAAALACYHSPEYQRAIALRTPHSTGDVIIIEGYDGPQP